MTSSLSNNKFSTLEELYDAIEHKTSKKAKAELLLALRGWYLSIVVFDDKSGETLNSGLENFLDKVNNATVLNDYIHRIINHSGDAIKHIFQNPREKILREHAIIPIYSAREVDSQSVQWLSRQSGRNLREKLAEKPYIKAVKRRFSLDTTENKLFKAFIFRLEQYLFEKEDALLLDSKSTNLLQDIERWLNEDMTKEIGSWSNFPPNNTLLQDKYYRKIWDSWLWLQELDDLIIEDNKEYKDNFFSILFWTLVSKLNRYKEIMLLQQPINLDYNEFKIKPYQKISGCFYSNQQKKEIICEFSDNKIKITLGLKILFMCEVRKNNQLKVILNNDVKEYNYSIETIQKLKKEFSIFCVEKYSLSTQKKSENKSILSNTTILDLDLIYPKFITDDDVVKSLEDRLVTQYWNDNDEFVNIDCYKAKAVLLNPNILTISMKNIFLIKDFNKQIDTTIILNEFTKKIAKKIDTKHLIYLVSDRVDEFSSEKLRKSLNYAFSETTPLPRSIASAFYLQNAKGFSKYKFLKDDMFVVIEVTSENISATKLLARPNIKLKKILPKSEGITWERHPSIDIEGIKKPKKTLFNILDKTPFMKDIIDIWGKNGLEKESSKFSWSSNSTNFFIYDKKNTFDKIDIDWKQVKLKLNIKDSNKFKIIIIGEYANQVRLLGQNTINLENNLLEGAKYLDEWQKEVKDIPLWRDHLPELSFNIPQDGVYKDFYLVKNETIIPRKGLVSNIVIDTPLTLPKNKEFYEFPLKLGNGNSELEFMAYLRSSIFPFNKDIICHLRMTYTYGADDPYALYFEPKNDKDKILFNAIKVEWKEMSKRENINAPIPDFPKRYSWKNFEKFPNKNNDGFKNLLEWLESEIKDIIELNNFISSDATYKIKKRSFINMVNIQWKQAGNGDYFCRYMLPNHKEIFIHQKEYQKFNINYKIISFDIKETRGDLTAVKISEGKSIVDSLDFTNKLRNSIRFPLLTVWNQGHSLSESDVPDNFRKIMYKGIKSIEALLKNKELNHHIKKELVYILSILHKDIPITFSKYLLNQSKKENIQQGDNGKMVAYAIGDASCNWQKELLDNALHSTQLITVLSIALWRSDRLIYKLSKNQLTLIINEIVKSKFDIDRKNIYRTTQKLEIILSILRTRGNEDEEIKNIFAINSINNKKFIQIVEKLTSDIIKKNIPIKTRITFNLNKPKSLNKTDDLLYALRLYLTGEDGANSIEVSQVESE